MLGLKLHHDSEKESFGISLIADKSRLFQAMAWCRRATSHNLNKKEWWKATYNNVLVFWQEMRFDKKCNISQQQQIKSDAKRWNTLGCLN